MSSKKWESQSKKLLAGYSLKMERLQSILLKNFIKKMKLKDLELNYLLININQLTIQLTKKGDNMTITIQHNGSLLISDIIKDEYIKRVYYGYNKKDAIQLFKQYRKEIKGIK